MRFVLPLLLAVSILIASCSDDSTGPATDGTPPASVANLAIQDSTDSSVTLTWTAPGDDGTEGQAARYDVRCSQSLLTNAEWHAAMVADTLKVPKIAGQAETLTVAGLANGDWFFALKTVDEAPNWSGISNVASTTLVDTVAPGAVTDLAAVSMTESTVGLSWTTPGDNGQTGQAAAYDLRYALTEITEETWESAIDAVGEPAPGVAGTIASFVITGLDAVTRYYFAVKTIDEAGNSSSLSNVASEETVQFVRLTHSPANHAGASSPVWSPDGESIAFLADWESGDYDSDLYLIPAMGGTATRLADDPDGVYYPSWSPDGSKIAFVMDPGVGHTIYTRLASPGATRVEVLRPGKEVNGCAWAPTDDRIAYLINHYPTPSWQIFTVHATGGTPELLLTSYDRLAGLAWSPDGTKVALDTYKGGNWDIWVVSVDDGGLVQLTDDAGSDFSPVWAPDGSQIAFASERSGTGNIWLVDANGGEAVQITFETTRWVSPHSWSPDGTRIAVTMPTEAGGTDIWVLYVD